MRNHKQHKIIAPAKLAKLLGMEGDVEVVYVDDYPQYVHVITSSDNPFKGSRNVAPDGYVEISSQSE